MKRKISVICLILVFVFALQGNVRATAFSTDTWISSYRDDALDIDPVETKTIPRTWSGASSSLEESYYSPYVTSVKNQNPYGTCWAFAYIAASEASVVKEGLITIGNDGESINLSELHLAYFLSHSVTDPLGGTDGDGFSVVDTSTNAFLEAGGNQSLATYRVANWYGLVNEEVASYDSISATESVLLADEMAYQEDMFHLENAYWISMQDADTVKQLIKQYGACATAYYSAGKYYNTGSENSYNQEKEVAVYCPEDVDTNHGITIVGWDDNYSVDNFTGAYKPTEDGAWYCKNSWGDAWSKDGYFWISYEDVPLLNSEAFFYDYGVADNYDNNYQYDGGAVSAYYPKQYSANIYTAKESEYIKAVGFYTYDSNYDCTIKIYKNCSADNPTNGTLLTTVTADQLYAGFHTVMLDKGYLVNEDEQFSVVIYATATDGEDTYSVVDVNYSKTGAWCENVSVVNVGESFISDNGESWTDLSSMSTPGNCRIKAYTDKKIFVEQATLQQDTISLNVGESEELSVILEPENASDKSVIWSSEDTTVATVDENGKVTAIGRGTTMITGMAADGSGVFDQCEIIVTQPVTNLMLSYKSYEMMKDGELQLVATIVPENANDQRIQWLVEDETIAKISQDGLVTGLKGGTTTVSCVALDCNTCVATCSITVVEPMISISLDCSSAVLEKGQTLQINTTTVPELSYTKGVYWVSSDTAVAKVDDNGLVIAVSVGGPVAIRCIARDGSGVKDECLVTVITKESNATEDQTSDSNNSGANGTVDANSQTENELRKKQYKLSEDGTAEYSIGKEASAVVEIPDTIDIDGKTYKVTAIAAAAFENNKEITQIIIGNNVKSIGKNAFKGCSNLKRVTIGDNVNKIGTNAFYNCKNLKNVTLGKSVTVIQDKAFYKCSKLNKLTIPAKVKKIGKQAFYKCSKLKTITIKTSKLTSKKIGKNAFKGIHSKATIQVPKKKWSTYKRLLKAKGVGSKATIKR